MQFNDRIAPHSPRRGNRIVLLVVLALPLLLAACGTSPATIVPNPTTLTGNTANPFITVTWSTDAGCQTATISESDLVIAGPCDGEQTPMPFGAETPDAREEFDYLTNGFAPFTVETRSGTIEFGGDGTEQATPAQQRMIAEWTRWVAEPATAGSTDATTGLALSWHREGGVAGFCDDLAVYRYGIATASSCKGAPTDWGQQWLTDEQLTQLYGWLDEVAPVQIEQTDAATADAMTETLVLNGAGEAQPSAEQQQELLLWASTLHLGFANESAQR